MDGEIPNSSKNSEVKSHVSRGPKGEKGALSERILSSAQASFASQGFQATTLSSVAKAAGVDSSLVNYYFDNKFGLLFAVLSKSSASATSIAEAAKVPLKRRGKAVLKAFLEVCDGEESGDLIRSILMCASIEPLAVQQIREIFVVHLEKSVSQSFPVYDRRIRTGMLSTHLVGLAMTRYVWKVGPLSELESPEIVNLLSPIVQSYLSEPIPVGEI